MMKSIVEENQVSFKTLEQKVFTFVCGLAQEITRTMLESYDAELAKDRDKKAYRDKGLRTTTIKTVYGEVSYSRRVYQTVMEDGHRAHVYLLDEAMHMDKIGVDLDKPCRKDCDDSNRIPIPGNGRNDKQHMWTKYQSWRGLEPGVAAGRTNQQGRMPYGGTNGNRPARGNRGYSSIIRGNGWRLAFNTG